MRYRLRTLMVVLALGPIILALLWIAAPTDFMHRLAGACVAGGWAVVAALVICAAFGFLPARENASAKIGPVLMTLLWCVQAVTLWLWIWGALNILGWLWIWG